MPHNWKAYDIAKLIAEQLLEGGYIKEKDILAIRGIIQIVIEEGKDDSKIA